MKLRYKLIPIIAGALIMVAFSPAVSFIFTFTSATGMLLGLALIIIGCLLPQIAALLKRTWAKILLCLVLVLVAAAIATASVFTYNIVKYSDECDSPIDATIIVLGCQLKSGKPGKMLAQRLERAYQYLCDNPDAVCILTGGQGPDESRPEATAMQEYLVDKGIDEQRLYTETESSNTEENMQGCARIIEDNSLSRDIVVVTNGFHQYRANVYARQCGLAAYALNCKTDINVLATYWLREMMAIAKMKLVLAH